MVASGYSSRQHTLKCSAKFPLLDRLTCSTAENLTVGLYMKRQDRFQNLKDIWQQRYCPTARTRLGRILFYTGTRPNEAAALKSGIVDLLSSKATN